MDEAGMEALVSRLEQAQLAGNEALLVRMRAANEDMVAKMEAENKVRSLCAVWVRGKEIGGGC
jgi:anti-anti-sigma regulatory factor